MRSILSLLFYLLVATSVAQNQKAINWINAHALTIEDASPDTKLELFSANVPQKFAAAKVFGFGETTHQGKEFFDIKAKFFKYLVEHQDVTVFIMENSYPSEAAINEWISGGNGDAATIANHFTIGFWYCREIVQLLEWMRSYNLTKTGNEQIRFYGMDIQNVQGINQELRDLVTKYTIPVSEELLLVADQCVAKEIIYSEKTDWADIQIPKLHEMERLLIDFRKGLPNENIEELNTAIRALNYLIQYTYYVQHHYSQDRDLKMFENVQWIVANKSTNGKAFIWAHNEHINNKQFGNYHGRNIYNLGRHLKEYYKNDYYSVGFDFGSGTQAGYYSTDDEKPTWKLVELKEPFPDTYAQTLIQAKDTIYFIDIATALKGDASDFFEKKTKQILAGAGGINPSKNHLYQKKFSEMYDGLIFVKNISLPTSIGAGK